MKTTVGTTQKSEHGLTDQQIQTMMYQSINVTILFTALILILRKPLKQFFINKNELFLSEANKKAVLINQAKSQQEEMNVKLSKLDMTTQESISRARAEAADLKKQIIEEAKVTAGRIIEEAKVTAHMESAKASNFLRMQLIKQATDLSREQIKLKVTSEEHQRLQVDFIDNIKAVRQ